MNRRRYRRSWWRRLRLAFWRARRRRPAAILVWLAMMIITLFGFTGLIVDMGMMMATHRQVQNAVDAAAVAAAREMMLGGTADKCRTAAREYLQYNGITDLVAHPPVVNLPPSHGPYTGRPNYVEVIAGNTAPAFLIPILGVNEQTVRARAVAGFERRSAGEGVVLLDPTAVPGLSVQGNAHLVVHGRINVNSEGSGWPSDPSFFDDKDGNGWVDLGLSSYALASGRVDPNPPDPRYPYPVYATQTRVVGGADNPYFYRHITEDRPALVTESHPFPDPLLHLPTPWIGMGVPSYDNMDATPLYGDAWKGTNTSGRWDRGTVTLNGTPLPGDPLLDAENRLLSDPAGLNRVRYNTEDFPGEYAVYLHPGVYKSITIEGDLKARFLPGIYVLKPATNTTTVLSVTNFTGQVVAEGIMFYNTGSNYQPLNGQPDLHDASKGHAPPGDPENPKYANIKINSSIRFSPIDTSNPEFQTYYSWARAANAELDPQYQVPDVMALFDGMLFYQRRWSWGSLDIAGDSSEGFLSGTLYAKWGFTKITGSGTYDAQFAVGSMAIAGNGLVTILDTGKRGKAPRVYLVEGKLSGHHDETGSP